MVTADVTYAGADFEYYSGAERRIGAIIPAQEVEMADVKVVGPGFIGITVSDAKRSADFYEKYLGAQRDPFDFGPSAAAVYSWPAIGLSEPRPGAPGPSPDATTIALWWRASDAQALYDLVKKDGVRVIREPFDGPFGRTFVMADPDGYKITIYEKDQPLFWPPKP